MNTESKAAQELREWTKHYGFVPVIKAAEAVLAELAAVTKERDKAQKVCRLLVEEWKKQKSTWPIMSIVARAEEALKGDKL